jgi:hypothetical protein
MEEVRVVSASGGAKGQKIERFDLIPPNVLFQLATHYGKGDAKYNKEGDNPRNWERGYPWSWSYAALCRHLFAWWGGEDIDEETGSSHLIAVIFHAFAMVEWMKTHPEYDDRPK